MALESAAGSTPASSSKGFSEVSNLLLNHLRGKPECRDLVTELMNANQPNGPTPSSSGDSADKCPGDKRV